MKEDYRFQESAITEAFFKNFPSPETGDDTAACNAKLNAMLGACKDMYNLAREARSITILQKARTMKEQVAEIFTFLQAQHQKAKSGIVTPSGMPAVDSTAWMR